MTPNQVRLIRETWLQVVPIADTAARLFYQRLFDIDPSTIPLFAKSDMKRQHDRLIEALALVVQNAEWPEQLVPTLTQLGRRHMAYGVEERHYDSVGDALIWTLEQGLGDAFTAEARDAWTAAYAFVAGTMRQAAREVVAADTNKSRRPARTTLTSALATGLGRAAVIVCLTFGTAAALTAVTAPITATQVEAGVWGKIKKGVKKAGGKIKEGAKLAKDSVKELRDAKAKVRKAIRDTGATIVGKTTGEVVKRSHEVVLQTTGQWDKNAKESVKTTAGAAENLIRRDLPGLADTTKKDVGEFFVDCLYRNGIGCNFDPPKARPPSPKPVNGPGGWGRPGGAPPSFGGPNQSVAGKGQTSAITLKKNPPSARDRSIWGRPVAKGEGQKATIALRKDRPEQTRPGKHPPVKNVPPPRSTKFPRPRKGYPRHRYPPRGETKGNKATITLKQGKLGNDRSIWGRSVGTKKRPAMKGAKAPVKGITKRDLQSRQKSSRRTLRGRSAHRNINQIIRNQRLQRNNKQIIRGSRMKNRTRQNFRSQRHRMRSNRMHRNRSFSSQRHDRRNFRRRNR